MLKILIVTDVEILKASYGRFEKVKKIFLKICNESGFVNQKTRLIEEKNIAGHNGEG